MKPEPPWKDLFGGTREESPMDSETSNPGGTMLFFSWVWNTGQARRYK